MKQKIEHLLYAIEAIGGLIVYDIASRMGFAQTHALVAKCPVVKRRPSDEATARICARWLKRPCGTSSVSCACRSLP